MTKSALLDMIHQVSVISDQEVEELEKLVQNFPYCQTAHLLIAKASYDKGNMLSNQKLRKAAAYATNRHLLKKLIYTTDAAVSLAAIEPTPATNNIPVPHPEIAEPKSAAALTSGNTPGNPLVDPELIRFNHTPESAVDTAAAALPIPEVPFEPLASTLPEENQPEELVKITDIISVDYEEDRILEPAQARAKEEQPNTVASISDGTEAAVNIASDPEEVKEVNAANKPDPAPILPPSEAVVTFTVSELDELLQVKHLTRNRSSEAVAEENAVVEPVTPENKVYLVETAAEKAAEPPLELVAPPIIRYELFAPDEPEEIPLEQTLASFDSYLFKPEKDEHPTGELKPATPEEFNYEVYIRNQLGYWLGSSRLGELLQVKDELTTHTPLQFYLDLILEYSKQNYLTPTDPPAVTNVSRQFALIDQFLKANPKLKSIGSDKVRSEPQDDLALKSTKNTKSLASENLAAIMVQQGKIKKAIKIYEHLILRIPEKKAYFTAQIEKLRNLT